MPRTVTSLGVLQSLSVKVTTATLFTSEPPCALGSTSMPSWTFWLTTTTSTRVKRCSAMELQPAMLTKKLPSPPCSVVAQVTGAAVTVTKLPFSSRLVTSASAGSMSR
jgi:hypothetical protein